MHGDVAVIIDGGYAFIAAVILGPAGHVLGMAVRKYAVTINCCSAPGRKEASCGSTSIAVTRASDSCGAGIPWAIQPGNHFVLGRADRKSPSAAVRNRQGGLSAGSSSCAGSIRSVRRASAW